MDTGVFSQAQLSHQILTFDIPDEALERAANADQAYTWAYCTRAIAPVLRRPSRCEGALGHNLTR
jgi:hypothetical protein